MKLQALFETAIPFDTSTTHMPTYDDMMKDPDYFREKKHRVFTIMYMKPDEYIDHVFREFRDLGHLKPWQDKNDLRRTRATELIDKYAEKMQRGEKFPMVVLDHTSALVARGQRERSFSQEGLHRAYAAKKLGVEKIPVMVVDDA